jgi:hypothetical protein
MIDTTETLMITMAITAVLSFAIGYVTGRQVNIGG